MNTSYILLAISLFVAVYIAHALLRRTETVRFEREHRMAGRVVHCLDCDKAQALIALESALICSSCGSKAWVYRNRFHRS